MHTPNTVFFRLSARGPKTTAVFFVCRNTLKPLEANAYVEGLPPTLSTRVHVMGAKTQALIYQTERSADVTRKMMETAGFVFVNQALMNNPDTSWVEGMPQNWSKDMTPLNRYQIPFDVLSGDDTSVSDEDWIALAKPASETKPKTKAKKDKQKIGFSVQPVWLGNNNEKQGAYVSLFDLNELEDILEEFYPEEILNNTLTQEAWNELSTKQRKEIFSNIEHDGLPTKNIIDIFENTPSLPDNIQTQFANNSEKIVLPWGGEIFLEGDLGEMSKTLQAAGWVCLHDENNVVAKDSMLKPGECKVFVFCREAYDTGDDISDDVALNGHTPDVQTETEIFILPTKEHHRSFDNLRENGLTHPPFFLLDKNHPFACDNDAENTWSTQANARERKDLIKNFEDLGYVYIPGTP